MASSEAMTSSTHSFAYSYGLVKKCFLKICETSKFHNFLIFQPIFIRFSLFCSENFTLSSEIKLDQLRTSPLRGGVHTCHLDDPGNPEAVSWLVRVPVVNLYHGACQVPLPLLGQGCLHIATMMKSSRSLKNKDRKNDPDWYFISLYINIAPNLPRQKYKLLQAKIKILE